MKSFASIGVIACALLLQGACSSPGKTYDTPAEAADALVGAVTPIDEQNVRTVLGSNGLKVLREGDPADAEENAARFREAFQARHAFVENENGSMTLEVGGDAWPFPIPLVKSGTGWRWDTDAGEEEILTRRIGRNELDAIQSCLAVIDAQREYAASGAGGTQGIYADRFVSSEGMRNGLYWPTGPGEAPSPLGPTLADATPEVLAAAAKGRGPRSFHGYRFRMLRSQGAMAPGGAMNYEKDGHLTGGFAVVAWPAEYGRTGIMTFMTSNSGVVFERDLGSGTEGTAMRMRTFDPTKEWLVVPLDQE